MQSCLEIQCSALLDGGTSRAYHLTPGCTCCEGFYQNYKFTFHKSIIHRYRLQIHNKCYSISIISVLERQYLFYINLSYQYCILIHDITCTHSNFDVIEPFNKTLNLIWNLLRTTSHHLRRLNVKFASLIARPNIVFILDKCKSTSVTSVSVEFRCRFQHSEQTYCKFLKMYQVM